MGLADSTPRRHPRTTVSSPKKIRSPSTGSYDSGLTSSRLSVYADIGLSRLVKLSVHRSSLRPCSSTSKTGTLSTPRSALSAKVTCLSSFHPQIRRRCIVCAGRRGFPRPPGHGLTAPSYIPLLLLPLPLSLSPIHLSIFLVLTYLLNRPCIYCSFLLIILFASSCHWSGQCFASFSSGVAEGDGWGPAGWFIPRLYTQNVTVGADPTTTNGSVADALAEAANSTISTLAVAAWHEVKMRLLHSPASLPNRTLEQEGIGTAWIKSWIGRSEWTLPCVNLSIRI